MDGLNAGWPPLDALQQLTLGGDPEAIAGAPVHAIEGNAVDAVNLATSCRHKEPDAAHYGRENLEI